MTYFYSLTVCVLLLAFAGAVVGCGWERNTYNSADYNLHYTFGAYRGTSVVIPVPTSASRLVSLKLYYVSGGVINDIGTPMYTHWGCGSGTVFPASLAITDDSTTPTLYFVNYCRDTSAQDGNVTPYVLNFGYLSWVSGKNLRVWYSEDYANGLYENNLGKTEFTYVLEYDIQGLPCPVCNDSKVSGTEECDSVKWCDTKVCACLDGSVNVTGKNQCECPTLETIDPQVLKGQPTLTTRLSGTNLDSVDIDLKLPQMSPHRWNVSAVFVNPNTNEKSSVVVALTEHPCFWRAVATYDLQYIINNAKPYTTIKDTYYNFLFNIMVSATENITLAGHSADRRVTYAVAFSIKVIREVNLESIITSLDSSLLWAYIAKGRVNVPTSGSGYPSIYLEIVTVTVEDGFRIKKGTLLPSSYKGNVVSLSTPVFMYEMSNGWERWNMTATLAAGSVCSTSYADNFTLSYTIYDSVRNGSATHSSSLTASLGGLENWCAQNSTITLNGVQKMYTSLSSTDAVTRFFIGDTVYVRDQIVNTDLTITSTDVSSVTVSGGLTGSIELVGSSKYGYHRDSCPTSDGSWVCYHFVLDKQYFASGESIKIATLLYVNIDVSSSKRSDMSNYQNLKVQTIAGIVAQGSAESTAASQAALPTGASNLLNPSLLLSAFAALLCLALHL